MDERGVEYEAAACGYATDKTDCESLAGLRTLESLGPLSYAYPGQPHPPMPSPPPSPPSSPPPPPPAFAFVSCLDTCADTSGVCSDGGAGAMLQLVNGARRFTCDYGTSCAACGARRDELFVATDSCTINGVACGRNGQCDDTVANGLAGYGTDASDCGPRAVRQVAGAYPSEEVRTLDGWYECARLCMSFYQDASKCREKCGDPDLPEGVPEAVDTPDLSNNFAKPPLPPRPPPPPFPPPPPPHPPPPLHLDYCTCSCTGATQTHANADAEWSEMALVAMAVPKPNTRLYAAKGALARGAEQRPTGSAWVTGYNDGIKRYLDSPALSPPVAHLTDNWRIDASAAVSVPLGRITSAPASINPGTYAEVSPHRTCFGNEASVTALTAVGDSYGVYPEPALANIAAACEGEPSCVGWVVVWSDLDGANPNPTGAASLLSHSGSDFVTDVVSECSADSFFNSMFTTYAYTRGTSNWIDWTTLPQASTSADDWQARCLAVCAERVPRYMLHYMQVDIDNDSCDCYASATTPEPPDNAAVSHWMGQHGTHVTSGNVHVYSVGPPAWRSTFLEKRGGTLYHAPAFVPGVTLRADQLTNLGVVTTILPFDGNANLVTNGDFSDPPIPATGHVDLGESAPPGWRVAPWSSAGMKWFIAGNRATSVRLPFYGNHLPGWDYTANTPSGATHVLFSDRPTMHKSTGLYQPLGGLEVGVTYVVKAEIVGDYAFSQVNGDFYVTDDAGTASATDGTECGAHHGAFSHLQSGCNAAGGSCEHGGAAVVCPASHPVCGATFWYQFGFSATCWDGGNVVALHNYDIDELDHSYSNTCVGCTRGADDPDAWTTVEFEFVATSSTMRLWHSPNSRMGVALANVRVHQASGVVGKTFEACAEECVRAFGSVPVGGVSHDSDSGECKCATEERDPVALHNRAILVPTAATTQLYAAHWCAHVRPDSNDGAYVYHNDTGAWCPGRVAARMGEAVLGGEVHPQHEDVALTCKRSCDATPHCELAEVLATSWSDVMGAPLLHPSPPPSPPHPPPSPPPPHSPLPPNFPLAQDGERFRTWTPDGDGQSDLAQDVDGGYSIACGAPSSCNTGALPVFRGEYLSVISLARELRQRGAFDSSLCPWECWPTLESHELDEDDAIGVLSGVGFSGLRFRGVAGATIDESSTRGVVLAPTHVAFGVSHSECGQKLVNGYASAAAIVHGPLALWVRDLNGNDGTGECFTYRATRSALQTTLWASAGAWGRRITELSHFRSPEATATRVPSEETACSSVSSVCAFWAEFDDDAYRCMPMQDLSNVLTPMKLVGTLTTAGVYYPPPTPPPPHPPSPPSPPPPCANANLEPLPSQSPTKAHAYPPTLCAGRPCTAWTRSCRCSTPSCSRATRRASAGSGSRTPTAPTSGRPTSRTATCTRATPSARARTT